MLMRFASQKQTREKKKRNTDGISHISHTAKGHTWPYMINLFSEMFHSPKTVNNFIADCNETCISSLNLKPHICCIKN